MRSIWTSLLSAFVILVACQKREGSARLAGALCANIPVFEPSELIASEDHSFQAGADFASLKRYAAIQWELTTPRPFAEVVAFYTQAMPPEPDADATGGDEMDDDLDDEGDGDDDDGGEGENKAGGGAGPQAAAEAHFVSFPMGREADIDVQVTVQRGPANGQTRITIREAAPADRR